MDERRDLERVLWRSRRGMLELDILLVDFARSRYPQLPDSERADYRELLRLDDWVLLDWLRGRVVPEPRFAEIVGTIGAFNAGC